MNFKRWVWILILFNLIGAKSWAKNWDPRLAEANHLAFQGNYASALKVIESYIQSAPDDPNGYFIKGNILDWKAALTGQGRAAQKEMVDLLEKANDKAFHYWDKDQENVDKLIDLGQSYLFLGRKYSDVGSWMKAVLTAKKCQKHLEKAVKKDPSRVDALLSLGGFHYLADNIPSGARSFRGLLGIKGSRSQGLSELNKALGGNHPFVWDTKYALFNIYLDYEKNASMALNFIQNLEKEFPNNPEFKFQKARAYELQDRVKGIQGFLELADFCQKNSCHKNYLFLSYYHAGRLNKDLGKNEPAKDLFAKAISFDTGFYPNLAAEAHYWPGLLEEAAKNFPTAINKYKKAKEIKGISKELKKNIQNSLEQLCSRPEVNYQC